MKSKLFTLITLLVTALLIVSTNIYALSPAKWYSINTDSEYYNGSVNSCSSPILSLLSQSSSNSNTTWNSGVSGPYYVESFVVNVLEDIASKLNVPVNNVLTQQHVLALVAWAYLEGGNITNTFYFNLWNTDYRQTNLLATVQSPGGFPTYASFDAGVEAAAISMTGSYQNRIGTVLADPTSSATQVLNTVSFPQPNYPTNLGWDTSSPPATYDSKLLQVLTQAENNYSIYASIIIGPGQENSAHVATSSLKYNYGSLSTIQTVNNPTSPAAYVNPCSSSTDCSVSTTSTNAAILCEAKKYDGIYYSWGGGHGSYSTFRQNCPESAISSAASTSTPSSPGPCATDCSGLVSVAIDAVFNQTYDMGVSDSTAQMTGGGSQYWQPIQLNQVQAGDIATENINNVGHVEIVDHYNASTNTLYTFGSHSPNTKTSENSTVGYFTNFYRWTGPTS